MRSHTANVLVFLLREVLLRLFLLPSLPSFLFQVAHWRAAHKAVCGKPQEGGEGAQLLPQPPRRVTAADRARWGKQIHAAADLGNAGRYAEVRSSMERMVAEIESGELGREAKELLPPLELLACSLQRAGLLDDAYNVMMRAMLLCEKLHGEEGLATCRIRTIMGECWSCFAVLCPYAIFLLFLFFSQ